MIISWSSSKNIILGGGGWLHSSQFWRWSIDDHWATSKITTVSLPWSPTLIWLWPLMLLYDHIMIIIRIKMISTPKNVFSVWSWDDHWLSSNIIKDHNKITVIILNTSFTLKKFNFSFSSISISSRGTFCLVQYQRIF